MKPAILVIDDADDERESLARLFLLHGYQVELASEGSQALERLHGGESRPSVILLDLNMPVLDGWGFLAKVALEPALRAIPVVVMSGSPAAADTAVPPGVAFVTKPLRPNALLRVVAEAVHGVAAGTGELAVGGIVSDPADYVDTEPFEVPVSGEPTAEPRSVGSIMTGLAAALVTSPPSPED
jgi:CheY-like chemotaxis protein